MAIDPKEFKKKLDRIQSADSFSPPSFDREAKYKDAAYDLLKEIELCYRLLEDLTPGGSEFYANPRRCAEYLHEELKSRLAMAIGLKKEVNQLSKEIGRPHDRSLTLGRSFFNPLDKR